jgi:hypothetical protein
MISINALDYLESVADLQVDTIPGGVIYLIAEGNSYIWRKPSKIFDIDYFQVGDTIEEDSIVAKAMREMTTLTEDIQKATYGTRLRITADPVVDDDGNVVGAFCIVYPRQHPVAKAFSDFAPIVSEVFPEGSQIVMTDLEKVIYSQSSTKFNIPSIGVGYKLDENSNATRVINTRKLEIVEDDGKRFGVPVMIATYPLFDEENSSQIIGTFGVITPRTVAISLKNMSNNLSEGIGGISKAIEQLSSSASNIHGNEQKLNSDISEVISLSDKINQISSFIKDIADQTKMLGLNAAIEAARAGEAGKGFGVVADQIRKLSEQSKSTVPQIKGLTDDIKNKIDESSKISTNSLASSEAQVSATQEITSNIEELSALSEELNEIALKL